MSHIVRSKGVMPSLWKQQSCFLLYGLVLVSAWAVCAHGAERHGGEYNITGPAVGEQSRPQIAISAEGGYLVWQDNAIDGANLGIAARRLNQNLSVAYAAFRVNKTTAGWQENPHVALMRNGSAAIVWQGGKMGSQDIFMRVVSASGIFSTSADVQVNTWSGGTQADPVIACMTNGNLAVVWSSSLQDGSHQGIYGRVMHRNTTPVSKPFRINQFTANNQRNPSISALSNGTFVVVWASENQGLSGGDVIRNTNRVHLYGRLFNEVGDALGNEFRINTRSNLCATPTVAPLGRHGFTVAWAERSDVRTNGWDIYARHFEPNGNPIQGDFVINELTYGDQFSPKLSCISDQQLLVWTSLRQDGSYSGVFGRLLTSGQINGNEFQVNTLSTMNQMQPVAAGDSSNRFVVAWSGYMGSSGYDVRAQRFAVGQPPLPAPEPPLASALSQTSIGLVWSDVAELPLAHYEVFIDGAQSPIILNNARSVAAGFAPGSTHTFELAFVLADGRRSEKSATVTARTWGADLLGASGGPDGLPDDWQTAFWGNKPASWYGAHSDDDHDGATNYQEFLAGTDPTDPRSVLKVTYNQGTLGRYLHWNTRPGSIYQVQHSIHVGQWEDYGPPRRAAGSEDLVLLEADEQTAFYRVVRLQ